MTDLSSILVPPLMFFALGFLAKILKSDLDVPSNFTKAISIYLMIGIGLHGGTQLQSCELIKSLLSVSVGLIFGFLQPIISYFILHVFGKLPKADSAAIAAHYGSVSIGTFLTAVAFLENQKINFESYPLIMMAVMESPAILIGLLLARINLGKKQHNSRNNKISKIIREVITNGSVLLLTGSLLIGFMAHKKHLDNLDPFYNGIFGGVLSLFLLAMGIEAAIKFQDFKKVGKFLVCFAILNPIVFGIIGVLVGTKILNFGIGGSTLVGVLLASSSYVAVPPAMKIGIPKANPSLYLTASLGITFPFNVIFGIPIYFGFAKFIAS